MDFKNLAKGVDSAEVKSSGGGFVKNHDIALVEVDKAEFLEANWGGKQRYYFDVVLRLLTTANGNNPKSDTSEGDVIKHRVVFQAEDMGDREKTVKASIMKQFCESVNIKNLSDFASGASAALAMSKVKLKIAIGYQAGFFINNETGEPTKTNYATVKWVNHVDDSMTADLNKLSIPSPMSPKKLLDFNSKLEYWASQQTQGISTTQNASNALDETMGGVQDDFPL